MPITADEMVEVKEIFKNEIAAFKQAIDDDISGKFGDPDSEWRKFLDEKIGEMQDQLKELMKPRSKGADDGQDAFDSIYGKDALAFGKFAIDVKEEAVKKAMPERLRNYKIAYEDAAKAAGDGLEENFDSEGGFLIPVEQSAEMLTMGEALSQIFPLVRHLPMSSNTLKLNYVKDTDRSGGTLFGGVILRWTAEKTELEASKPALGQVTLSLNKLVGLAYATSELIEDSPISIGPWLSQEFAEAFGWQMDYEIINGSGAGAPEGILNSDALITIDEVTGQDAETIEVQNVIDMYARMPSRNRQNAIWLANDDTLTQLMTMVLTAGTAGVPVWLPANSLANQPHDSFMGKKIVYTEHCQALGTAGDLIFFAPQQYLMGMKSTGVRADTSIHLKFDFDQTTFRFVWRVDGRCPWPAPQTPRHSSATRSPLLVVETRDG